MKQSAFASQGLSNFSSLHLKTSMEADLMSDVSDQVSSPKEVCDSSTSYPNMLGYCCTDTVSCPERRSTMDNRLRELFKTVDGIVAVGGNGLILQGTWEEKTVAVKIWNGGSPQGFLSIRSEIEIFKEIEERCPSILGTSVPKILLGWDNPELLSVYRKEVILVTDLVGHKVSMDANGCLVLETDEEIEELKESDVNLIKNAALESLALLHVNGFIRGDIAMRNMRVKREVHPPYKHSKCWRVWWVDLGEASEFTHNKAENIYNVEHERKLCEALFRQNNRLV